MAGQEQGAGMEQTFFSKEYDEARYRFRDAMGRLRGELYSYPLGENVSQDLTIDVGILGDHSSKNAIVVSSGVHGVEAFVGSAIQLAWLKQFAERYETPDSRCVLIHGVNPYGFAHGRRFNEDNVDLNRNFLADPDKYLGSPQGYGSLNDFLNPRSPPSPWEPYHLMAHWYIWTHGLQSIKATVAGGQYEFPEGLFFGGHGPSRSTQVVQHNFRSWIGESDTIAHIDFHSGLGKYGDSRLLPIDSADSESYEWFAATYGAKVVHPVSASLGIAYNQTGNMGEWIKSHLRPRVYRFVTAEFGTYDVIRIIGALRAENQAHFYGDIATQRAAKSELKECFCPCDPIWRQNVVTSGLDIIWRCLRPV